MLIGYARVSTHEQDTAMQLSLLKRTGCDLIYQEKKSAVKARPEFERLLSELKQGDILVVYKLDRIARSLSHLLSVLDRLTLVGAGLRSLTEPIDTSSPVGLFTIQVLGAVAQFERALIRERSIAGQVAAYQRGVKLGRRRGSTPEHVVEQMRAMHRCEGVTYPDVARAFGVHPSTAKRLITGKSSRQVMPVLSRVIQGMQT